MRMYQQNFIESGAGHDEAGHGEGHVTHGGPEKFPSPVEQPVYTLGKEQPGFFLPEDREYMGEALMHQHLFPMPMLPLGRGPTGNLSGPGPMPFAAGQTMVDLPGFAGFIPILDERGMLGRMPVGHGQAFHHFPAGQGEAYPPPPPSLPPSVQKKGPQSQDFMFPTPESMIPAGMKMPLGMMYTPPMYHQQQHPDVAVNPSALSNRSSSPGPGGATSIFQFRPAGQKIATEQIVEKQKKRKESHNAVERRRRDHINEMIQQLGTMVEDGEDNSRLNKGEILEKAVNRIRLLEQIVEAQRVHLARIDPTFTITTMPSAPVSTASMPEATAEQEQ